MIGRIDPQLKYRIDHIQEYIDEMIERYVYVPKDVLLALFNKKMELVELV